MGPWGAWPLLLQPACLPSCPQGCPWAQPHPSMEMLPLPQGPLPHNPACSLTMALESTLPVQHPESPEKASSGTCRGPVLPLAMPGRSLVLPLMLLWPFQVFSAALTTTPLLALSKYPTRGKN